MQQTMQQEDAGDARRAAWSCVRIAARLAIVLALLAAGCRYTGTHQPGR
jgi:hypothetical protein